MKPFSNRNISLIYLISLISFFSLYSCEVKYRILEDDAREKGASVRITNFRRESVDNSGKPIWYLKAEDAYLYRGDGDTKESRIIVYGFVMTQYDSSGATLGDLSGERATVDYENQTVHVEGHVKYIEGPAKSIESEYMDYDMLSKILTTDAPVIIRENNIYTKCRSGVIVEKEIERQVCKNPSGVTEPVEGKPATESIEGLFH